MGGPSRYRPPPFGALAGWLATPRPRASPSAAGVASWRPPVPGPAPPPPPAPFRPPLPPWSEGGEPATPEPPAPLELPGPPRVKGKGAATIDERIEPEKGYPAERLRASKPLEPGSADRPDARARLRREARALAELDGADRRVLDAAEEAGVGWPRRGGV
jgi:hypothetical protein